MINRKSVTIISLLLMCILSVYLLGWSSDCERFTNLLVGIIASSLTLIVFEVIDFSYERCAFSYLKGKYRRIKIENGLDKRDPETDRIYKDMTDRYANASVNPEVSMKYEGNCKYSGQLDYEEGHAKFTIDLNRENKYTGKGIYSYASKKDKYRKDMPDNGNYEVVVVEPNNPIRIHVHFRNLIPSNLAYGYEIWEKL